MKKYLSNRKAIVVFCLPAILLFSVFILVPILQVFYYSFFKWDGVNQATFIGLDNYVRLMTKDP